MNDQTTDPKEVTPESPSSCRSVSNDLLSCFFARLVPFCTIAFSDEHQRLSMLDCDSDRQLIDQQHAFLSFYRDNAERWARFYRETNGYIYAADSEDVVIVAEEWLRDRSPEVQMAR